jgi:hypothetical protein
MISCRWLTACLMLALCGGCSARDTRPAAPTNSLYLILIDRSESVNKPEMRQLYSRNLRIILGSVDHGDVLVLGWITDRSAGELELPVNESLPAFCPETDNPLMLAPLRARADSGLKVRLSVISDSVAQLLASSQRPVMHTAIVESLELAQRVFASYDAATKVLVLMSDMEEDSEKLNFAKERLAGARSDSIIGQLRNAGRMPDLRGVHVYVLGATTGNGPRDREIHNFWMSFFKSTGAELRPADYGAALVAFPQPNAQVNCP